jgi:hypothetical protein
MLGYEFLESQNLFSNLFVFYLKITQETYQNLFSTSKHPTKKVKDLIEKSSNSVVNI